MVIAKIWTIEKKVEGELKLDDFICVEKELPPFEDGDILVEAVCYSVDPYHRYKIRQMDIGEPIFGSQVAKIIESRNEKWSVGTMIVLYYGWQTRCIVKKEMLEKESGFTVYCIPELDDNPVSTALGILGMPGNTAYFGFLEICKPKKGDVVLVNAAAGAVGSAVCQIAKIKGCTVIAFAGSDAKVSWLKEIGIDHVFNYKSVDISKVLSEVAPNGINCYFDNVGGDFTAKALPHMAEFARISLCGAISTYNDESSDIGVINKNSPFTEATVLWRQLKIEGFLVLRWLDRFSEGFSQMLNWLKEGKLKYKETVTHGFENMPKAFLGLFYGENIGKAIVMA